MSHLSEFIASHNLDQTLDYSSIEVAADALYEANNVVWKTVGHIDAKTNRQGFVIRAHLNIIGRLFEQAQGMLVCIATKCPTSAESSGGGLHKPYVYVVKESRNRTDRLSRDMA